MSRVELHACLLELSPAEFPKVDKLSFKTDRRECEPSDWSQMSQKELDDSSLPGRLRASPLRSSLLVEEEAGVGDKVKWNPLFGPEVQVFCLKRWWEAGDSKSLVRSLGKERLSPRVDRDVWDADNASLQVSLNELCCEMPSSFPFTMAATPLVKWRWSLSVSLMARESFSNSSTQSNACICFASLAASSARAFCSPNHADFASASQSVALGVGGCTASAAGGCI
mmetsp:Transcript_84750/g.168317  ORF Transcript_84750/g.168317 Transcript_84750/m.168317 type:complete len:225 (-) Transcript_84750:767-1441(-)